MLATSAGRLLFNIGHSVAQLQDEALTRAAARDASWDTARWAATEFASLLLDSALPRGPIVTALRLRALLYHPPPVTVHYYTCDFCEAHVDSPWSHVAHVCPVFLLRVQWAFVRRLSTLPKQVGSYLADGSTLVQPSSATAIAVALETDHQVPKPLSPLHVTVYTPSGLVSHPGELQTRRPSARDHVRLILETMADHSRTLVDLLLVPDTLEWPARPTPSLNPHIHVLTAEKVLPLSVAFLARWTTCHLQGWRMVTGGLLPMRMPPPPPPPPVGPPK